MSEENRNLNENIVVEVIHPTDMNSPHADVIQNLLDHQHQRRVKMKFHERLKLFLRTKFYIAMNIILAVVLITAAICVLYVTKQPVKNIAENSAISVQNEPLSVKITSYQEPQLLVDQLVMDYLNQSDLTVFDILDANPEHEERLDTERRVKLFYEVENMPDATYLLKGTLLVSETPDYAEPVTYEVVNSKGFCELKFLKTSTTYYYKITFSLTDGSEVSDEGSFETAESPRFITLDGTANVRDIGGWTTTDGKTIKQGLLYRGGELDGLCDSSYKLTNSGLADAIDSLKIKSDFDLRGATETPPGYSVLGDNVNYNSYGYYAYESIFLPSGMEATGKLFSDLAKEEHYPIYMHCTYGIDVTGTACYILEALLGVSEENINRDYCLSYFRHMTFQDENQSYANFVIRFRNLEGNDLQEKAAGYLRSCGVTDEEIQQIKDIFLE